MFRYDEYGNREDIERLSLEILYLHILEPEMTSIERYSNEWISVTPPLHINITTSDGRLYFYFPDSDVDEIIKMVKELIK